MKPVDVNQTHILALVKKLMIKMLNLKLVILLEYQNMTIFPQKTMFRIGLKMFLWLKKLNKLCCGHVISDLNGEKIVGTFNK